MRTNGIGAKLIDRLWRVAYWIGFRLALVWWWLRRPDHHGALVAVWHNGQILMVRQSYRNNLSWPGGGIDPGEDPKEAARRELAEELGLVVAAADLVPVRQMVVDWDFRRDHVHIFELHLLAKPQIKIDGREIVAARFSEPLALLVEKDISPMLRAYLEEATRAS